MVWRLAHGPARGHPLFSCVSLFISSPFFIDIVNGYLTVASYPNVSFLPGGTSAMIQRMSVY